MISYLSFIVVFISSCNVSSAPGNERGCTCAKLTNVNHVEVWQSADKKSIFFTAGFAVDADGSPRAYHPQDIGLDYLEHAGAEWEGIAHDEKGPIIQGPGDPAPGYYVSQTSLVYPNRRISDPGRYINAEAIPYIVLPASLAEKAGVKLGDIAVVWNRKNDWFYYAIYADTGPEGKLGEGSIALAEKLGIDPNPRHGGVASDVAYIVFPGSGNGGPLEVKDIERKGKKLLEKWGGFDKAKKCLN